MLTGIYSGFLVWRPLPAVFGILIVLVPVAV